MSVHANESGMSFEAGFFLADDENALRKTKTIPQQGATTLASGAKIVKAGSVYSVTTGTGNEAVTDYIGFVYEDIDVTKGDAAGSVVVKGVVYEDKLPTTLTSAIKTALEAKGFTFVTTPTVTRPNFKG
jgi:hypothetical protein